MMPDVQKRSWLKKHMEVDMSLGEAKVWPVGDDGAVREGIADGCDSPQHPHDEHLEL